MSLSKKNLERITHALAAMLLALLLVLVANGCSLLAEDGEFMSMIPSAPCDTTDTGPPPWWPPAPVDSTDCGPPGPPCDPPHHNRGRGKGPK